MKIEIFDTYDELSQWAGELILETVREKPDALLCIASGSTPIGTYRALATNSEPALFSKVRIQQLDEWAGLETEGEGTSRTFIRRHLLIPLEIPEDRARLIDASAPPETEAARVRDQLQKDGPIDLCILGIGTNGHLGFNEPAAEWSDRTHVATLAETTRDHTMVRDLGDAPTEGVTLGIRDIMESRQVLLLISGAHKAEAVSRLMEGQVGPGFPATVLWDHPSVICACDRDAIDT